jgi:hypothetical protein
MPAEVGYGEGEEMKRLTNEQIIRKLMNVSPFGAMAQLVIIHAIRQYCKIVSELEQQPPEWNDFVCWESWKGACEHIKQEMDKFYGNQER